jgi:hypothetical protein
MAALRVNMVCHLWDLADEGIEKVLDHLASEVGVAGVSVPVVCPAVSHLRTRPGLTPRVAWAPGGVFFAPHEQLYAATRCKPVVSRWLKSRDLLGEVVEACRARSLDCRAVVHTTNAGQMASRYPDAAVKTVFGDGWPDRICPVNPDVQAFLTAICRDLAANYGVSAIELADLYPGRTLTAQPGCASSPRLGSGGWALLKLCFCESCRQLSGAGSQSADVDPAAAARSVEVRLQKVYDSGGTSSAGPGGLPADDPVLAAYVTAQWRAMGKLTAVIARECRGDLVLRCYDDAVRAADAPFGGPELPPGVKVQMAVRALDPSDAVDAAAGTAVESAGGAARAELLIRLLAGDAAQSADASGQALVRGLARLNDLGLASVTMESYGEMPAAGLDGVRQAIRFARRASGGPAGSQPG